MFYHLGTFVLPMTGLGARTHIDSSTSRGSELLNSGSGDYMEVTEEFEERDTRSRGKREADNPATATEQIAEAATDVLRATSALGKRETDNPTVKTVWGATTLTKTIRSLSYAPYTAMSHYPDSCQHSGSRPASPMPRDFWPRGSPSYRRQHPGITTVSPRRLTSNICESVGPDNRQFCVASLAQSAIVGEKTKGTQRARHTL